MGNRERETGNGERGTGNKEPGTGVWEREHSGSLHENSKWRTKHMKRVSTKCRLQTADRLLKCKKQTADRVHSADQVRNKDFRLDTKRRLRIKTVFTSNM